MNTHKQTAMRKCISYNSIDELAKNGKNIMNKLQQTQKDNYDTIKHLIKYELDKDLTVNTMMPNFYHKLSYHT